MIDRIPRPAEGWVAVLLVIAMAVIVALAIDDPAFVVGRDRLTDWLAPAAALGVLAGIGGAKAGWRRWLVHLVGAAFAGVILPVLTGWALEPGSGIGEAFRVTAEGTVNAYLDLAWRGRRLTEETAHFVLLLGVVAWASGQFAGYAVFGHRRPLHAVVVLGIVLVITMSLTRNDQLRYLVAFSGAALFLLIGMHVFDERVTWMRRRIGDPSQLSGLYLRGGTALVVATVLGSLVLTQTASSAPLQGAFSGVDQRLIAIGEQITRYLPVGGAQRTLTVSFDDGRPISGQWFENPGVAFVARFEASEIERPYYRASVYDTLDGMRWYQGGPQRAVSTVEVAAGSDVLFGTDEIVAENLVRPITFSIEQRGWQGPEILSPASPQLVSVDADLKLVDGIYFGGLRRDGTAPYQVTANVYREANDGFNQNLLRQAGTDYPASITDRYLQVPEGMFADGTAALALYEEITGGLEGATAYDLAYAIERYLRNDPSFTYDTDVREFDCDPIGVVECFARYRVGYCEYFASTMTMLLRYAGIPARYARGFLPGNRTPGAEEDVVQIKSSHSWVEAYFPNVGWVLFDPTKSVAQSTPPIEGPPLASAAPGASGSPSASTPGRTRPPEDREPDDATSGAGGTIGGPTNPGPFIAIAVLLAVGVGALGAVSWVRGPRGPVTPQTAWAGVGRLAARLGFAPRPTQTIYEYAASLGELVPAARPDLQTVARAQVEVAYGRGRLTSDRLRSIREANRRLRVALLRLLFRRSERRRRMRRIG